MFCKKGFVIVQELLFYVCEVCNLPSYLHIGRTP
jgi:hypothetical protein